MKGKPYAYLNRHKKVFDRIQHPFMIKTQEPLCKENFHGLIKGIYKNPNITSYLMVKD